MTTDREAGAPTTVSLHVVATAGHVDHGKSSLVARLTGMDPDRFAEEKRRGLTIDLGFAWCTLPSGREIGFVDVPGHERFVHNMLAGVGPVRPVLFVVAADEGWKPQTEEHLAIVDLLGTRHAVVALSKSDLVDADALARVTDDVRGRLAKTGIAGAPIVACSARTGDGIDALLTALDALCAASSAPDPRAGVQRARQFVDRVFTIPGAGTVVTGTLTGGPLSVADEVELLPGGERARIRGMQSHKRSFERAVPVARVAVNLASVQRSRLARGDVLGHVGEWRATGEFEAMVLPVRGLDHELTSRAAFKLYAGAAERDARVRFYARPGPEGAFARIRTTAPLVLDVFDRFILRDSGRRATVAGGVVLDIAPPLRPGIDAEQRLAARAAADREELPGLLVSERGAVREGDVLRLTGAIPDAGLDRIGGWVVAPETRRHITETVLGTLARFHDAEPLKPGADVAAIRTAASDRLTRARTPHDNDLIQGVIDELTQGGTVIRQGAVLRLATHRPAADAAAFDHLVQQVAQTPATPPTIPDLQRLGFPRDLIAAATAARALVAVSRDVVVTPAFAADAEAAARDLGAGGVGITVSAFRERIGTTRKYAVPLLEYLDTRGVTVRRGDVRILRTPLA